MNTVRRDNALRGYAIVTAAYWAFMLTDGALRMLVLLHFHSLGFSPIQLAYLFLLYEFMGMVTNYLAGWLGTRFGLRTTLITGLGLQVVSLFGFQHISGCDCPLSGVKLMKSLIFVSPFSI